jgi:hypothetical protein
MNADDVRTLLTWALAAAGGVWALWLCSPQLLDLLGLGGFANGVRGGPEEMGDDRIPEGHAALAGQLRELGFTPLGVYWEGVRSGPTFEEWVYFSREERCYASLYGFTRGVPRVSFITALADGGQIHTKNFTLGVEADADGLLARGTATRDLTEVLSLHRDGVARFASQGRRPTDCYDLTHYSRVQVEYYHNPLLRGPARKEGLQILGMKLATLAAFSGLASAWAGWHLGEPATWVGLLAGCFFVAAVRKILLRAIATVGTAEEGCPLDALTGQGVPNERATTAAAGGDAERPGSDAR